MILVVVVLAITGVFGGGDDDEATAGDDAPTTTASQATSRSSASRLQPVGGGDARGEAVFGLATGDQPYVDVSIERPRPGARRTRPT